MYKIKF